jgi:hypothetical protein
MRSFSGESTIANGIEPRSCDTPAGSSLTPVGSRRTPDGSWAVTVPSTCVEGDVQALAISVAASRRVNVGFMRERWH